MLLANLLALLLVALPLPRAMRKMRCLMPGALLIAVAQVLVEGARWQMVPAYALSGLFFLLWLRQNMRRAGESAGPKRINRLGIGLLGPIDGARAHRIINAYSLAFFERHLKGRPQKLLDGPAMPYPEVHFEVRHHAAQW